MSCDIDIILAERDSTLYLPIEAVYEDFGVEARKSDKKGTRGRSIVYRKEAKEFVEKEIQFGLRSEARVEILSGLVLDDEVAANAGKIYREKNGERRK